MDRLQTTATQVSEQTARWYHAATLTERAATLPPGQTMPDSADREQAEKKLRQWQEQPPFNKASRFADRLAMDSITEQEFLTLLAEPIEAVQARLALPAPPAWVADLARIFATYPFASEQLLPLQEADENYEAYTLLQPFAPLLQSGIERFQAGVDALVQEYHTLPFDPQTILALLFHNLAQQTLPMVNRTLVLELNIARLRGRLQGETPQERFQNYQHVLSQRENLLVFLEEYCILARQILTSADLWADCSLEFLRHLCADWTDILKVFTPEQDPGVLIKASGGAGDTHRGGHSVMLLKFHSGFQLVYKPRSSSIDVHFQELLTWLNERGQQPALRSLQLIDKETHGWTEFVAVAECSSEEEVRRFYERQGGYLALLYVLKAVDFHAENIIAAGEHPILIDLEALFHHDVKVDVPVRRPASTTIEQSVLRLALLPQRFWSNDQFEGIDMSGLGNTQGQLTPQAVAQWKGSGTDEMKLVRERIELQGNRNCPRLHGQSVQALDYIDSIITGFTATYRLLSKLREEFLADVLPRFAHDTVRFIARATRMYGMLLRESFHPNMLRDALKRERFFDRLWMAAETQTYLARLITAERKDLLRGDIPMFTTHPASCDLFSSEGVRIPEFFEKPGLELVKQRMHMLNEEDLQQQIWIIRAAFTSISTSTHSRSGSTTLPPSTRAHVEREEFISAARAAGDRLCESALVREDLADWVGLSWIKEREWSIMPASSDLNNGLPGIILFLSYLGVITGDARYTTYAQAALEMLRVEIKQIKTGSDGVTMNGIGTCKALGACIYLFSHLATLWHEPALLKDAEELVSLLSEHTEKDDMFDIADGSAGCIASLLSLYSVAPSVHTLTAAIKCGDHLLAHAQAMKQGAGWQAPRQTAPLAGFAHGAAGIAWSLLKLAEVSGEERFRQTALSALAYERSLFSPEKHNWLDLRSDPLAAAQQPGQEDQIEEQKYSLSWSYGAPGIALGRLASLSYIDDALIREEIEFALNTTLAEGFGCNHKHVGPNHSLYHGDLGNLETLLVATQTLDDAQYQAHLARISTQVLESIAAHGLLMGTPMNVETPGLMLGLAGMGYELLRLAEPTQVPSVLLLAPPTA